jgi:hypothetical protein
MGPGGRAEQGRKVGRQAGRHHLRPERLCQCASQLPLNNLHTNTHTRHPWPAPSHTPPRPTSRQEMTWLSAPYPSASWIRSFSSSHSSLMSSSQYSLQWIGKAVWAGRFHTLLLPGSERLLASDVGRLLCNTARAGMKPCVA